MMNTVALADVAAQPWRNGGGTTQELLAWPASTDKDGWALRVSVAHIAKSGPFSAYAGIERWFTVLHGEGVVLRFDARRAMLTEGSEPIRFEGAAAPGCDLLDGPTQDLNLMLRHSAGRGGLLPARAGIDWHSTAPWRAVFTLDEAKLEGAEPTLLPAGSLVWAEAASAQRWCLTSSVSRLRAWWLYFAPHTR